MDDKVAAGREPSWEAPELEAELSENDFVHYCLDLERLPTGIRLLAVCRPSAFRGMRSIVAIDSRRRAVPLFFRVIHRRERHCYYETYIPSALLSGRLVFNAVPAKGRATRVWTAGRAMPLPKGWYFTKFSLNLAYDPAVDSRALEEDEWRHYFKDFEVAGGVASIQLSHYGPKAPNVIDVAVYKFRDEDEQFHSFPAPRLAKKSFRIPNSLHERYNAHSVYHSKVDIPVDECFRSPGLYSIMVRVDGGRARGIYPYNRNYSRKKEVFIEEGEERTFLVHHFSDKSSKNVRIEFFSWEGKLGEELGRLLEPLTEVAGEGGDLVLCGEYTTTARDNGWAIFSHLQSQFGSESSSYVIDGKNRDGIVPNGASILQYGSIQHLTACRRARAVLFTHHSVYVVPNVMQRVYEQSRRRPVTYFLQHGVLAIKPVLQDYVKKVCQYDLFNVSSRREQELVVRSCGFEPEHVTVAGLPRWDKLSLDAEARDGPGRKQKVLVFPTWRRGLDKLDDVEFCNTQFFRDWRAGLVLVAEQCRRYGYEPHFCVHSIFERFMGAFEVPGVQMQPLTAVVDQLPTYDLLVTDYSSLCFDFVYLRRPTVFYMFDRAEFFKVEKPYVDPELLPGPIVETASDLAGAIFTSDGSLRQELFEKVVDVRPQYAGFDDRANCSRIVDALNDFIKRREKIEGALETDHRWLAEG